MRDLARLFQELRGLLRLAIPLAFVQFNTQLTSAVDTALAGHASQLCLAATGLGSALFFAASVVGMGCGFGADPFIAQALGAGRQTAARYWLWQAVYLALLMAIPLWAVAWALTTALPDLGVAPALAAEVRRFLLGRWPSLLPFSLVTVLRVYLQALQLTRPVVISAIVMNALNGVLDWILLFGDAGLVRLGLPPLGVPALGTLGLGLASTLATGVQAAMLMWVVARLPSTGVAGADADGLRADKLRAARWPRPCASDIGRVAKVGLPTGFQLLAEVGVFSLVSLLIGGMGTQVMAAHQTALTLISLSFSVCLGIGSATAVYVGKAVGAGDDCQAQRMGFLGIGCGITFMGGAAAIIALFPDLLLRVLSNDAGVIATAIPLLRIGAMFQMVDGAQAVAAGALRGTGKTRGAFFANVAGHWLLGVPVGCLLTFVLGQGAAGLWWGLTVGLAAVALTLCVYFWRLSSKPIRRLEI